MHGNQEKDGGGSCCDRSEDRVPMVEDRPSQRRNRSPLKIVVSRRRMTFEEERRINEAVRLFCSELVRQHLHGKRGSHV